MVRWISWYSRQLFART